MNGYEVIYLYYKQTGKSEITIPRAIIEANNLDWYHKDNIFLLGKEYQEKKGLFLSKEGTGHVTSYLYYNKTKRSMVTIPRIVVTANKLRWNHKEKLSLIVIESNDHKGLFLFKKEDE
ncbi:MAG: hypothetical protein ACFFDH_16075 [Promethearchaeota archaeon]